MKKLLTLLLALCMVLTLSACSSKTENNVVEETPFDFSTKSEGVLTYSEYEALPSDGSAEVVIEAYVQAVQSYWNGAVLYLADTDGAYFVYNDGNNPNISEEDFASVVTSTDYSDTWFGEGTGVKVKVTGTKSEWAGEVEIVDSKVEVVDTEHTYKAEALTLNAIDAKDVNKLVKLENCEVVSLDKKASDSDPDLYLTVTFNGEQLDLCVENYLSRPQTEVYKTVEGLTAGQTIDVTGFLYWYNGANPHVVEVTVK